MEKSKFVTKIIIFSLIFFIIGGITGYVIGDKPSGPTGNFAEGKGNSNFPDNFQINDTVKSEISSFFDSTEDTEEINNYCQANPMYCMEYCKSINPYDEICTELNTNFDKGMPSKWNLLLNL